MYIAALDTLPNRNYELLIASIFVSQSSASVLDDDVFFSCRLWHSVHLFTKFTDQQCCILNSAGAFSKLFTVSTCLHLSWNVCGTLYVQIFEVCKF